MPTLDPFVSCAFNAREAWLGFKTTLRPVRAGQAHQALSLATLRARLIKRHVAFEIIDLVAASLCRLAVAPYRRIAANAR